MRPDRRKFIRDTLCAALGGASVYSVLGQMQLARAATSLNANFTGGYKALVCVFLYGGNDSLNMIIPTGSKSADYTALRPNLAINTGLHPLTAAPTSGAGSPGDGNTYAMHPAMQGLADLFNANKAAIVANVGPMVGPVSQTAVLNDTAVLPPQLTSHADQQAYWQSSPPTNQPATGWGGKLADLIAAANPGNAVPVLTSMGGLDAFLRGSNVTGYVMNSYGPNTVDFPYVGNFGINTPFNAFNGSGQANALERAYAATMQHSMSTASLIQATLDNPSIPNFDANFVGAGDLGTQLQTVASLIWAANNGIASYASPNRQIFFVSLDDFDTHGDQLPRQDATLAYVSKALAGFYKSLHELGPANSLSLVEKVTAFTVSDFGRSLSNNEDGTDHGWGGHHLVVGGAVNGGKFYGDSYAQNGNAVMPSLKIGTNNNPNDNGNSQLIPTTSADQYTATLLRWFGLTDPEVGLILPNLGLFNNRYLGFLPSS